MIDIHIVVLYNPSTSLQGEHACSSHDVTRGSLGVNQRSLQDFHRDRGAGLGIGQSVMVIREVVPAGSGDGLELVVGQGATEMSP